MASTRRPCRFRLVDRADLDQHLDRVSMGCGDEGLGITPEEDDRGDAFVGGRGDLLEEEAAVVMRVDSGALGDN